jgi:hypothetical protein
MTIYIYIYLYNWSESEIRVKHQVLFPRGRPQPLGWGFLSGEERPQDRPPWDRDGTPVGTGTGTGTGSGTLDVLTWWISPNSRGDWDDLWSYRLFGDFFVLEHHQVEDDLGYYPHRRTTSRNSDLISKNWNVNKKWMLKHQTSGAEPWNICSCCEQKKMAAWPFGFSGFGFSGSEDIHKKI